MSIELGSAEAVVRDQAARAGVSPEQYVLRLALEDSVRRHAAWQAEHPELVEAAAQEAELALAEAGERRR